MTTIRPAIKKEYIVAPNKAAKTIRSMQEMKREKKKTIMSHMQHSHKPMAKIKYMFMWRRAFCACVSFFRYAKTKKNKLAAKFRAQITYFISSFLTVCCSFLFFLNCYYFLGRLRFFTSLLFKT